MASTLKTHDLEIPAFFDDKEISARYLKDTDQDAIFSLLKACEDFYLLSHGIPSAEDDAHDLLTDRPQGISPDQKAVIGFFDRNHGLVAALDFLVGYPEENIWFIGLLLIHPDYRGQGHGTRILSGFEAWVRTNQGKALMIGVLECNTAALRFWQNNGFREVERAGPRVYGLREHTVIRMRKNL
jgi:ribosomal protein S18 acetylase RimI-like enzyme